MDKLRILVVDDAIFMRTVLKNLFIKEGNCEIVGEAENGLQAIQKAAELQPDIITMDIIMPDLDGLQAVREILKLSPKSKIIMITSVSHSHAVNQAICLGAFDYYPKPLNSEDVSRIIRRVKKLREGRNE